MNTRAYLLIGLLTVTGCAQRASGEGTDVRVAPPSSAVTTAPSTSTTSTTKPYVYIPTDYAPDPVVVTPPTTQAVQRPAVPLPAYDPTADATYPADYVWPPDCDDQGPRWAFTYEEPRSVMMGTECDLLNAGYTAGEILTEDPRAEPPDPYGDYEDTIP
jgi:hypothetical protein